MKATATFADSNQFALQKSRFEMIMERLIATKLVKSALPMAKQCDHPNIMVYNYLDSIVCLDCKASCSNQLLNEFNWPDHWSNSEKLIFLEEYQK